MKYYRDYLKYAKENAEARKIEIINSNDSDNQLSFTPYIYNNCSASCKFCSEKLVRNGKVMVCNNICDAYVDKLIQAFRYVKNRKIFLSLSGKEPSESVDQLEKISIAVSKMEACGSKFTERVMYTNLSGFTKSWDQLIKVINDLKVSRIECSRHHYDETVNQNIVQFKYRELIKSNKVFIDVVHKLKNIVPVKMVCVFQKAGVCNAIEVVKYLDFARKAGVKEVVFRELAVFADAVDNGTTKDYIIENRVELMEILSELPDNEFHLNSIVEGYYYFSFSYSYKDMNVNFEMSDYEEMIKKHNSDDIYKLIFYPNGALCRDWNMEGKIAIDKVINDQYLDLLNLAKKITTKIDSVVIGSIGAKLVCPSVIDYVPTDLDLFINNTKSNISKLISELKTNGFKIYSWQDEITDDFDYKLLKGRYYLRAIKGNLVIDATYEKENLDYTDLVKDFIYIQGIRICNKKGLIKILEHSERNDLIRRQQAIRQNCRDEKASAGTGNRNYQPE